MRTSLPLGLVALMCTESIAQEIRVVEAVEKDGMVEIIIETTIDGPIEVMADIGLRGQEPDDIYVGSGGRVTLDGASTTVVISTLDGDGANLPSGDYEVTATFYPRWGAENAPIRTQEITDLIEADPYQITLTGSGISSEAVLDRANKRQWIMLNVFPGMPFRDDVFDRNLGTSIVLPSVIRRGQIAAWYFPKADVTVFVDTPSGNVATWRNGRQEHF